MAATTTSATAFTGLQTELARQGQVLTSLRDAVLAAGTRRGGSNYAQDFLRKVDLPARGDVTVLSGLEGFGPEHLTAEGITKVQEQSAAKFNERVTAFRQEAARAINSGYVTVDQVNAVYADAGLEPIQERITLSVRRATVTVPAGQDAEAVKAAINARLGDLGDGITLVLDFDQSTEAI